MTLPPIGDIDATKKWKEKEMTICKGKRYIKPTCDKCVELPYCKPTEKIKFKKAQQVYNKFLFDSHLKTLREVELQEKRISNVEGFRKDIVNQSLGHRIVALEKENDAALEAHRTRGLEINIILKRLAALEQGNTEQPRATHNARLEKLETDIKTRGEDFRRLAERVLLLESNALIGMKAYRDLETAFHRLETHIDVMESNARVTTECSNKQAHAIETLQIEMDYVKVRLGRCQDSVAELDPLGHVVTKKTRGRPPKTKI